MQWVSNRFVGWLNECLTEQTIYYLLSTTHHSTALPLDSSLRTSHGRVTIVTRPWQMLEATQNATTAVTHPYSLTSNTHQIQA